MTPVLSIVTGTVDRPASIGQFVKSVVAHTSLPYELLIIDAGASNVCMELPPQARVIPEKPRKSYVAGYNAAFRQCVGEFVVWMNDDAEVTPGWDVAAVDFMRAHPEVGLGCMPFKDPGEADFKICDLWYLPYANFGIIWRTLGNEVGWFDEDLTMYGSDNAITFKVLLAGHGVAPIYASRIIHHRERDGVRAMNQGARIKDGRTITSRYLPSLRRMSKTFWTKLPEACGYI